MESFTEHVKMRVKVVEQLESGSFTRLWLTLEPLSENYIGFLRPIESSSKIDTLSICAKGSMGSRDQYAMFYPCQDADQPLTNPIRRDYGNHGINTTFTTFHVPKIL